jgi:hypothetical protein
LDLPSHNWGCAAGFDEIYLTQVGGENMNNKVALVLTCMVGLLLLFSIMAPALANAPTRTAIKAVQAGTASAPEKTWTTNGGIAQSRGIVNTGTVSLYIPDTASSPQYIFNLYNVYDFTRDQATGLWVLRVDAQWRYEVNGELLGTFEGQINWNYPDAHGVLHGTGVFDGQTLMFWRDTAYPPTTWVGTLITS